MRKTSGQTAINKQRTMLFRLLLVAAFSWGGLDAGSGIGSILGAEINQGSGQTTGEGEPTGIMIDIPDPGLKAVIHETLGQGEETISLENMRTLIRLDARDRNIRSLAGLEHAVNLNFLHLDNNQLEDISQVTSLTNLSQLSLNSNLLTGLPSLKALTQLEYLEVNANQIKDLSFLDSMSNLKDLWLHGNPLHQVKFPPGLTSLRQLELSNCEITTFEFSDDWKNLVILNLAQNQLTDLPFTPGAARLSILDVKFNQLTRLELPGFLENLTFVDASANPLNQVHADTTLIQLKYLGISDFNTDKSKTNTLTMPAGVDIGTRGPWHFPIVNLEGAETTFYPNIRDIHFTESGSFAFSIHAEAGNYTLMQSSDLITWTELEPIRITDTDIPELISHGAMSFFFQTGEIQYEIPRNAWMKAAFYQIKQQ